MAEPASIGMKDTAVSMQIPQRMPTQTFTGVTAAVGRLQEIYERNTRFLRDRFEAYVNGEPPSTRVRATYPFVRITTSTRAARFTSLLRLRRGTWRIRDHRD